VVEERRAVRLEVAERKECSSRVGRGVTGKVLDDGDACALVHCAHGCIACAHVRSDSGEGAGHEGVHQGGVMGADCGSYAAHRVQAEAP
jgi:hypothetical protein